MRSSNSSFAKSIDLFKLSNVTIFLQQLLRSSFSLSTSLFFFFLLNTCFFIFRIFNLFKSESLELKVDLSFAHHRTFLCFSSSFLLLNKIM